MLVINAARNGVRPTEKRIAGWLGKWTDEYRVAGIVIAGCYVPERGNPRAGREIDLVVITPHVCVAVDVVNILPRAGGELSCSADGRWSLSGVPDDPVRVRPGDVNPINEVSDAFFDLKACADRVGFDAFVAGLVLVAGHARFPITVEWHGPPPHGCDVEAAGLSALRRYFRKSAARREVSWDAERVHAFLGALGYADRVTVEQLVAEGFPTGPARSTDGPVSGASAPSDVRRSSKPRGAGTTDPSVRQAPAARSGPGRPPVTPRNPATAPPPASGAPASGGPGSSGPGSGGPARGGSDPGRPTPSAAGRPPASGGPGTGGPGSDGPARPGGDPGRPTPSAGGPPPASGGP
ncbi:hypothetical protein ABZW59_09370, partial [Nocardia aurea]